MPKLYVIEKASSEIVAVFACDATADITPADAAAGCEHAAGDHHHTEAFEWRYSPDGLTVRAGATEKQVPPLSQATPRPDSVERRRADLRAQLDALETA